MILIRNLKKLTVIGFITVLLVSATSSLAQDAVLSNEIKRMKTIYKNYGYSLIEEGGGYLSKNKSFIFDRENFYSGNEYVLLIFSQDCSYCVFNYWYKNLKSGKTKKLNAVVQRKNGYYMGKFKTTQTVYSHGKLYVDLKGNKNKYIYGILYYKRAR